MFDLRSDIVRGADLPDSTGGQASAYHFEYRRTWPEPLYVSPVSSAEEHQACGGESAGDHAV